VSERRVRQRPLLRFYPRWWRERYGEELEALLSQSSSAKRIIMAGARGRRARGPRRAAARLGRRRRRAGVRARAQRPVARARRVGSRSRSPARGLTKARAGATRRERQRSEQRERVAGGESPWQRCASGKPGQRLGIGQTLPDQYAARSHDACYDAEKHASARPRANEAPGARVERLCRRACRTGVPSGAPPATTRRSIETPEARLVAGLLVLRPPGPDPGRSGDSLPSEEMVSAGSCTAEASPSARRSCYADETPRHESDPKMRILTSATSAASRGRVVGDGAGDCEPLAPKMQLDSCGAASSPYANVRSMMGTGPYRPVRELEGAIERRELDIAIGIAKDIARERRPIGLALALRLVSLVAAAGSAEGSGYDSWACRWLARWLGETPDATIALAAEVAATLADLPAEPRAVESIRELVR
jgi:hypothetical protein